MQITDRNKMGGGNVRSPQDRMLCCSGNFSRAGKRKRLLFLPLASERGSRGIIALTAADNRSYGIVHRSFNPDADHPEEKHLTLAVVILFSFFFS